MEPLSNCQEQQNEIRPAACEYWEHVTAGLFPDGWEQQQLPCRGQGEPDCTGQGAGSVGGPFNHTSISGSAFLLVTCSMTDINVCY